MSLSKPHISPDDLAPEFRAVWDWLDPEGHDALRSLIEQLETLDRAYRQACTNLATLRPDLARDLSIGETADLYYDALLSGWGGIEGFDPGRNSTSTPAKERQS